MIDSNRLRSRILLVIFCLSSVGLSQDQSRPQTSTTDEAALRAVAQQFFAAYAKKDLEGFTGLWSAKSPEIQARRKVMEERFVGIEKIELKSLAFRDLTIEGDKARVRVMVEMNALDSKTGKAAAGFGKMNRSLEFIKESDGWEVWRESSSEEELASALVATKTDEERTKLLAVEKDLVDVELCNALSELGTQQRAQSQFGETIRTFTLLERLAEQIDYKLAIAFAERGLAISHAELSDYGSALENFQKSLAIVEELGSKIQIASNLNNLGIVYRRQGNYNRALQYFQKSLAISEAIADKGGIALTMNNIGSVYYFQGNSTLAMEYYQKSLAMKEALIGAAPRSNGMLISIGSTLTNIGNVYDSQGDYTKAIEYYQKAQAQDEQVGDKVMLVNTLNDLATANVMQGDFQSATENYQKSLAQAESIGFKFGVGEALGNIGSLNIKQGDYKKALQLAERAAAIDREGGLRENLWQALTVVGKAHRALNQPDQARSAFDEAIATIESIRADIIGGEQAEQGYFEDKLSPYQAMVDLLVAESRNDEALAYAERSKARALLDVLNSGRINVTKAMTVGEQDQERTLTGRLFSLNSQITREGASPQSDPARLAALKADLQKARLDHEAFQATLYAAHPELKIRRGQAQPVTMQEAAELLPDAHSAMLEYVVTDDKTYLFVLTRETGADGGAKSVAVTSPTPALKVYTLDIKRKDLTDRAEAFRQQLALRDLRFSQSARALYDLLLKPARAQLQGKNQLIIVPDAALWQLPFQALQPASNRYLLEDAAIAYAPSFTVLHEMTKLHKRATPDAPASLTLLAIGNPALGRQTLERLRVANRDEKLDPLPEAEKEARTLGQLYGSDHSKVYIGSEAREDRVKAEAGKFTILHLATHGILDDASPMYSHLVLSQGEGDTSEDGLLETWEMMNLDLQADLVVLSACETARGRVADGEGVIGMSWALFVAGCPTAMVSQ